MQITFKSKANKLTLIKIINITNVLFTKSLLALSTNLSQRFQPPSSQRCSILVININNKSKLSVRRHDVSGCECFMCWNEEKKQWGVRHAAKVVKESHYFTIPLFLSTAQCEWKLNIWTAGLKLFTLFTVTKNVLC